MRYRVSTDAEFLPSSICERNPSETFGQLEQGQAPGLALLADCLADRLAQGVLRHPQQALAHQTSGHDFPELVDGEWLGQVVEDVGPETVQGAVHRRKARDDNHGGVRLMLLDPAEQVRGGQAGDDVVEDDELVELPVQGGLDLRRVANTLDDKIVRGEGLFDERAHWGLVVDDQDADFAGRAQIGLRPVAFAGGLHRTFGWCVHGRQVARVPWVGATGR